MNSNLITNTFTFKDLLLKKLYYSVICSVFSQLIVLLTYVFISNINIAHPSDWILSTVNTFLSLSTWLFVIPFITIIFAQSIICSKDYISKPSYCSTRFQQFISAFSIRNLILLVLNIIVGTASVWMFLSLGGEHQNLTSICKGQSYCLNEGSLYLISSGLWTGFYYFAKVYISEKHLEFPVIHQNKVLQFKSQLIPLIKESLIKSVWPLFYFVFLYTLWGNMFYQNLRATFGLLEGETSDGSFIYLKLWMFSTIYYFNMNMMRFFFNVFLTEPVEFLPCKQTDDSLCLQDFIHTSDFPIVQNLACLDLSNLAQWSKQRRQVFFTLSQPGGHPHIWNSLVESVLRLLTEYTELLSKSTESMERVSKPLPQVPIQSPIKYQNLRNMSCSSDMMTDIVDITHTSVPVISSVKAATDKLQEKITNMFGILKVLLGINFLFGELPQANIQKCLANGLTIIWTCQGISDLACASIMEDKYGIVQKDIPAIVSTLVKLKQNLDKLNKISALSKKIAGYDDFNCKMKGAVSAAVKRSLFNICRTFGKFMSEFPLNKDVALYLQTIYKS
nr:nucleoporin Ndc1 [Leptinotarsa decemlineata]